MVDEINILEEYPKEGRLTHIDSVSCSVGGLVPNVGIDIKRLDPTMPVYALGKVGNDDKADYLLNRLFENGIDVSGIKTSSVYGTGFTQVMSVIGGERTFFTYAGANADFGFGDIDFDSINEKLFHLGYFMLLEKVDNGDGEKILKELKKRGIKTSIDFVSSTKNDYRKVLPCLEYVDYLIVNELEAAGLCETDETDIRTLAERLKQKGVCEGVIIHKEDRACYLGNRYYELNALVAPKNLFKGKTGAGDAFCAGCLFEICSDSTPEKILETGIRAAAASVTETSATDGVRTKKEIYELTQNFKRR